MVTDHDEGLNSELRLSCLADQDSDICETFHVQTDRISDGNFTAIITLLKPLDYETRSSYVLTLLAEDGSITNPLKSMASISINIVDVQDQAPVFLNAPYSATIQENTPEDSSVLMISAIDGDTGNPRQILLSLENESKGYFKLEPISKNGTAILYTTHVPIDREDVDIFQNGGVYTFTVRATELINNRIPADYADTQITIVITDIDDHMPEFNEPHFEIDVPENLERGTPLPGLSIYVDDKDLGAHSQYNLSLRNVANAENVFEVSPMHGEGRTPVVVKVLDPSKLDYDVEDVELRVLKLDLVASVRGMDLSKTHVTVYLQDVNDNGPIFSNSSYDLNVNENAEIDTKVADIFAVDGDSGSFGKITYALKGFGSDNFRTDKFTGGLYVRKQLDYEQQKSYSLSIVAVDGGGWETNVNLYVNVIDLNDNAPMFESPEYTRTIREAATEFEPQFFVRAIDIDGPQQGNGRVVYSIDSENSISGRVFTIDGDSGEIKLERAANSMDTERGQYELTVAATDFGIPPLKNTTRVLVRVGISGNQRPVFKGRFNVLEKGDIPGPPRYRVSIPENATPGYNVTTVSATDPDGLDALLKYRIVSANDNFVIDESYVQLINIFPANFDSDLNSITVQVSCPYQRWPDSIEIPIRISIHWSLMQSMRVSQYPKQLQQLSTYTLMTSTTNHQSELELFFLNESTRIIAFFVCLLHRFLQQSSTAYISERTPIDAEVLKITAIDTDVDAKLIYSITEPTKAASKTGIQLTSIASYNYRTAFRIDESTGVIYVNNTLNHDLAAEIMLTIKVIDENAVYNRAQQFAMADVTIFVQSFVDTNPIFRNTGWTSSDPVVKASVKEEMPIGSTLFKLLAHDPVTEQTVEHFEIVQSDPFNYFSIDEQSGAVILQKRLDYEVLNETDIEFMVKAISGDGLRESSTKVRVNVENVNDNAPEFEQKIYRAVIVENSKYPDKVLTVRATDMDAELTPQDRTIGYSKVSYSLSGSNAVNFIIDNDSGLIQVAPDHIVDREKIAEMRFTVVAEDAAGKQTETRRSSADVIVTVLDVNDNAPTFSQKTYSAVIPENAEKNAFVFNISATDPDEGAGGEISYDFLNEGDAGGLLRLNAKTGEIRTRTALTGKGRSEPYELTIRAQDNGGRIEKQKSLFSDVPFILFIGDVSANDGIPFFIAPKLGQIANITEVR